MVTSQHYASPKYSGPRAACERIVVFNKRDLVSEWGIEVNSSSLTILCIELTFNLETKAFQESYGYEIPRPECILCELASNAGYQSSQRYARQYVNLTLEFSYLVAHADGRIGVAKRYPHIPELNVLVVGMPNVGKSTLLNALRNIGIKGRK